MGNPRSERIARIGWMDLEIAILAFVDLSSVRPGFWVRCMWKLGGVFLSGWVGWLERVDDCLYAVVGVGLEISM